MSVGGPFIRSLLVTKIRELIWTALQIETWCHHPINLMDCFEVWYMSVRIQRGVCWESVRSWESDSNKIWRADLKSSPYLESGFEKLSKLRPGVISNICYWLECSPSGVCQESVRGLSGICQEFVRSLSVVCQISDGNQIWRADSKSSPNWDLMSSPTCNLCCWV